MGVRVISAYGCTGIAKPTVLLALIAEARSADISEGTLPKTPTRVLSQAIPDFIAMHRFEP